MLTAPAWSLFCAVFTATSYIQSWTWSCSAAWKWEIMWPYPAKKTKRDRAEWLIEARKMNLIKVKAQFAFHARIKRKKNIANWGRKNLFTKNNKSNLINTWLSLFFFSSRLALPKFTFQRLFDFRKRNYSEILAFVTITNRTVVALGCAFSSCVW